MIDADSSVPLSRKSLISDESTVSPAYFARPHIAERAAYEPGGAQDEFIVTLLRQEIESALETFARPPDSRCKRALDIGCGRQPFRKVLEARGYSYYGLDPQQNIDESVDFIAAIDEPLATKFLKQDPFDFILCTEVLEHVADWDMAFRNIAGLLASGGRVLITCPHFFQLHEEPYDFWRPTLHSLQYFAWRVGLRTMQLKAAGDAWDILGTLLANCRPSPVRRTLVNRASSKLVALSQRVLFKLLFSRRLQRRVKMDGPLYMSNVVVF